MGLEKFLEASTAYINYEDSLKLLEDPEAFPTRVIPHEYGWWISVYFFMCPEESYRLQEMKQYGYSDAFINLVKFAAKRWINLECDAEEVDCEAEDELAYIVWG